MYTENYDQWFKMNKTFTAPLTEWNKTSTELCRKLSEQNLEIIGENFTRFSDQLKRFSNVRKPEDFINLQKDCFNEFLTATIENTQKIIHTTLENLEEFTKLYNGALRENTTTVTKAQEKSGK